MSAWRQGVTWLVLLATVVAQSNLPAFVGHAQALGSPPPAEALGRLFDALEAVAQDLPRDTFDLQAALMQSDLTPAGLLAWVRDNTYLVPYRGALRGPTGVLMDRVGNSLDRALLLQGLLQLLGYDTRLARAQLSETQAQEVLRRARPIPDAGARPDAAGANSSGDLGRYAAAFGLDPAQLEQALEQVTQQQVALRGELQARVEAQTAFLARALGSPAGDPAAERAEQLDALRDHWWVEVLENGVWTGLDPTLPDAAPGQALAAAAETLSAAKLEDLPSDVLHTLQIRVVLECAVNGGLQETTLVESPVLIPANLLGQRLAINHVPVKMPQAYDAGDVAAFKTLVLKQDRWFPVVSIGSQQIYTKDYTSSCEIGTATPPTIGTAIGGALEDALNVFGESAPEATERVTAQWIEYDLHVPGKAEQTVRRQIFDLLGPAARAARSAFAPTDAQKLEWRLALLGETEILPLSGALSPEFVEWLTAQSLVASREALLEMVRNAADPVKVNEAANHLAPQPTHLHTLALLRQSQSSDGVFIDQPNVLSYHHQQTLNAQGQLASLEGFDIVVNGVAADARTGNPFAARLKQGVVDTNAEALLVSLACENTSGIVCSEIPNPSQLFEIMAQQGIGWHTVGSASELAGATLPADLRARVEAELSEGYVVVIPERPVQLEGREAQAWWRIDANSGESLGMGEQGWGPEMAEYTFTVGAIALSAASCFKGAGNDPRCYLGVLFSGIAFLPMAAGLGALTAFIFLFAAFFFAAPSFAPY